MLKFQMPASEAVLTAVERMIAAPAFARQGRAAQILRYLVGETLAGRAAGIKESVIALDVFRRGTYDPRVDSLVRVEIAKLRQCIARYYAEDGKDDPIRIEIPKRNYAPVISERMGETGVDGKVDKPRVPFATAGRWAAAVLLGLSALLATAGWRRGGPAGLSGPPSVAVMPFTDLSSARRLTGFCEGLTEEVTSALAGADYLRVAARTSTAGFKDRHWDARRIGRELKVHALLEGSVQGEGRVVRATLRLVNAADGFHLWTQTFEGTLENPAESQRDLARRVESVFRFYLTGATRGLARPGTRNADAWHYYLRGAHMASAAEPERAAEFFRAAVAADSQYALAWAGLAQALVTLSEWGVEGTEVLLRASEAARRAMELDPEPPPVQQALAAVKVFVERDWRGAEAALRKAIASDPTDVNLRYDYARLVLAPQGRFEDAMDELRRALALHPRGNHLLNALAYTCIRAGRPREALPFVSRSLEINAGAPGAHVLRGMIAASLDGYPAALPFLRKAVALRPSDWTRTQLGVALARAGQRTEAGTLLEQIRDHYSAAVLHLSLGSPNRCLRALDRAFAAHSPSLPWVAVDPQLAELRSEPQFQALLAKMGLQPERAAALRFDGRALSARAVEEPR